MSSFIYFIYNLNYDLQYIISFKYVSLIMNYYKFIINDFIIVYNYIFLLTLIIYIYIIIYTQYI